MSNETCRCGAPSRYYQLSGEWTCGKGGCLAAAMDARAVNVGIILSKQEYEGMKARIAELEAQLNLHQERIDWLLSHCTVNRWDGLSLPSGSSEISGQDKLESICRIDKAIFRSKNNAL